jgi:hypothetical protein
MPDGVLRLELFNEGIFQEIEGRSRAMDRGLPGKLGSRILGHGARIPRGCWVSRIDGTCRKFQSFRRDYSGANSKQTRGVYAVYFLRPGLYEVEEQLSWKRSNRRFIRVTDEGEILAIGEEELCKALGEA